MRKSKVSGKYLKSLGVAALALLMFSTCGEEQSPVALQAPSRPMQALFGGLDEAVDSAVSSSDDVIESLPVVSSLFDFSSDGVIEFLRTPDLTLTRRTGKLIRAARGGSVELNGFRVDIPAGALARDTYVTIDLPTSLPEAKFVVADFGPSETRFSKPVAITLPLGGTRLGGIDLSEVHVAYWDGSRWVDYGGTATSVSVTAKTKHFSVYGAHSGNGARSGAETTSGG